MDEIHNSYQVLYKTSSKGQAIDDFLVELLVEDIKHEASTKDNISWKMHKNRLSNHSGSGVGIVLISLWRAHIEHGIMLNLIHLTMKHNIKLWF